MAAVRAGEWRTWEPDRLPRRRRPWRHARHRRLRAHRACGGASAPRASTWRSSTPAPTGAAWTSVARARRLRSRCTCPLTPETRHLIDAARAATHEADRGARQHRTRRDRRPGRARARPERRADRRRRARRHRPRAAARPTTRCCSAPNLLVVPHIGSATARHARAHGRRWRSTTCSPRWPAAPHARTTRRLEPMRVAVVDIGTNSTRLLVADVEDGRRRARARHAARGHAPRRGRRRDGRLGEAPMERVFERARGTTARAIDEHEPTPRTGVLTSAVRDAANGAEFARRGARALRLRRPHASRRRRGRADLPRRHQRPRPGDAAELAGDRHRRRLDRARRRVPAATCDFHVSTQAGVVRQTERHIRTDPPRADELADAGRRGRAAIFARRRAPGRARRASRPGSRSPGTATSCAAIAQALDPTTPRRSTGYVLERASCDACSSGWPRCRSTSGARSPGCTPTARRRSWPASSSSTRRWSVRPRRSRGLRARHPLGAPRMSRSVAKLGTDTPRHWGFLDGCSIGRLCSKAAGILARRPGEGGRASHARRPTLLIGSGEAASNRRLPPPGPPNRPLHGTYPCPS